MTDILNNINQLPLNSFSTLFVGLSGGVDSMVLLHAINQQPTLAGKVQAIHICHNINVTYSQAALTGSEDLCRKLGIPLIVKTFSPNLLNRTANLEEQARLARFDAFKEILKENDALLLGHHQDDQAETLLLRLFRGAGVAGLSSMKPVSHYDKMVIIRPFLDTAKRTIYDYACHHQLSWVEDPSNTDNHFDRNFIRNELLPLLNNRYPNIQKNLARTAKLCLESHTQLESLSQQSYLTCLSEKNTLSISQLIKHATAQQANIVRTWLRSENIKMPSQATLHNFLQALTNHQSDRHPLMEINGYCVQKHKDQLHIYPKIKSNNTLAPIQWHSPYQAIPIEPLKAHLLLSTDIANNNIYIPKLAKLTVTTRQSGEQMLVNGQTKKVKKLLQQLDIPCWQRPFVPLIYINNELAAIADRIIADPFKQPEKANYTLRLK